MKQIAIHTPEIQLDQFLKLAGAVMSGGEVKALVQEGRVKRNGEVETARRRKLRPGDVVTVEDESGSQSYQVTGE